jgi:molecular chaperone GrpE (heat shock protein)
MNNIWLEKIPSVWKNVDEQLHEVIHVKEINDNDKKWKIIEEVKPGYFIKIGNQKKVLQAAKVILGN